MATDFIAATDAILNTFKVKWDADTPAVTGGAAPAIVTEAIEADLKIHPRDTANPWTRIVVRHTDARKVTLNNAVRSARYRRDGMAWVQIFVPNNGGESYTVAQRLAVVAQAAFEGKRAAGDTIVFTKAAIVDAPAEGAFRRYDVKAQFYWDEVK